MPVSSKNKQQQVGVVAAREAVVRSYYVDSIKNSALQLDALDIHELARSNLQMVKASAEQQPGPVDADRQQPDCSVFITIPTCTYRANSRSAPISWRWPPAKTKAFTKRCCSSCSVRPTISRVFTGSARSPTACFRSSRITEKMAMYLQNLSNFDIEFVRPTTVKRSRSALFSCLLRRAARGVHDRAANQSVPRKLSRKAPVAVGGGRARARAAVLLVGLAGASYLLHTELTQTKRASSTRRSRRIASA